MEQAASGREGHHDNSRAGYTDQGHSRGHEKKIGQMPRSTPDKTTHHNNIQYVDKPHRKHEAPTSQNQKQSGTANRHGQSPSSRRSSTQSVRPSSKSKSSNQSQTRDFMASDKNVSSHSKQSSQSNLASGQRTSQRHKRPNSLQEVQPGIHLERTTAKYGSLPHSSKRCSLPPQNATPHISSQEYRQYLQEKHQKHYKRSISAPQSSQDRRDSDSPLRSRDIKYSTIQGQGRHVPPPPPSSHIKYSTLQSSRRSLQSVITEQPFSEHLSTLENQTPLKQNSKPVIAPPKKVSYENIKTDDLVDISLETSPSHETPDFTLSHSTLEKHRHQVQHGFPSAPYQPIPLLSRKNHCVACFSLFLLVFFSLLLFIPFSVIVIIFVPLSYLVKRLCDLCFFCSYWKNCCACCCHQHLSGSEKLWMDSAIQSTAVAQGLIIVQNGLDLQRVRDLINARLILAENRRGKRLYPRFTQKAAQFCCGYAWVNDLDFVINNHVFSMPNYIKTLDELQDYTSEMAGKKLSPEHPLWEIQVLANYGNQQDTVLLFRMHPCVTDGISLVRILEQALVDTHMIQLSDLNFAGTMNTCLQSLKAFFLGPITFIQKYLCLKKDFNIIHGRHIHPSGKMVVAWSEPFSLSAATRIKQVARCTLNELFISVAAATLRRYMQLNGISNPYNMHCAVPTDFNTNQSNITMGNNYAFVILPLPTNTEGAIPRLWETKISMENFKRSTEAAVVRSALWFTHTVMPKSSCQRFWRNIYKKCSCLITNLVGPKSVLKLANREIKCIIYWLPPLQEIAVSISFITYGEQIRMAIVSDRSVLPNPELLTADFYFQLETLSQLLANRRIPGEPIHRKTENTQLLSAFSLKDLSIDQMQLQMTLLQQEIHDIKTQLDASSSLRISRSEAHLMQRIEQLKEQFREIMVELRQKRSEEEAAVIVSDDMTLEDEIDVDRPQRPFRRRTLSMSSRMSTASVSSTVRPLSTTTSNQPSPTHSHLPVWPELEAHDVERALQTTSTKPGYRKHRLSTMDEYELDESFSESDEKRYRTY